MRHEPEAFAQLGFLLGLALGDLVAQIRAPRASAAPPVPQPVDGEGLGRTRRARTMA